MLNPKLQEYLKHQAHLVNPESQMSHGMLLESYLSGFRSHISFLDACGHDTSEFKAALTRAQAVLYELNEISKQAAMRFNAIRFHRAVQVPLMTPAPRE